jgi:hypothetical protein
MIFRSGAGMATGPAVTRQHAIALEVQVLPAPHYFSASFANCRHQPVFGSAIVPYRATSFGGSFSFSPGMRSVVGGPTWHVVSDGSKFSQFKQLLPRAGIPERSRSQRAKSRRGAG